MERVRVGKVWVGWEQPHMKSRVTKGVTGTLLVDK